MINRQSLNLAIKGISPDAEQFVTSALPTLGWVQRTIIIIIVIITIIVIIRLGSENLRTLEPWVAVVDCRAFP